MVHLLRTGDPRAGGAARSSRRRGLDWLLAVALLALGATACGAREPEPGPAKPDLLLVIVDTLRADRLACYGGPEDVGEFLCSLGDDGVRFVWAFSTAPYTAPSVASILTSQYPSAHRVSQFTDDPLAEETPTLAEALSAGGWATAAFVSNPALRSSRNLGQGFDVYDDHMARRERNRRVYERVADDTTDAALAWAREARRPWFLLVHYQDPHGPYDPPGVPLPPVAGGRELPLLDDNSGWGGIPAYQALDGVRAADVYETRYLEEIRYLDRHLRRLVEGLEATGARPGVLVTADHGEAFGDDGYYFAHGHSLGVDQIRVPLIWRPPAGPGAARGSAGGAVVWDPVSGLDVAPTLLGAAGVSASDAFLGAPLPAPRPLGAPPAGPARVFFAEHTVRVAVVEGRFYYARDHEAFQKPTRDQNSGGLLLPVPRRGALLSATGDFAAYEAARMSDGRWQRAEALVREHVAGMPGAPAEPRPLSPEVEERLRALGYFE